MKEIVIDFTQSDYSDAVVCPESSLIHQSQMEQVMSLIDKQYQKAIEERKSDNEFSVKHNTISIFASRGAGKTTFLLSTLDRIRKKYDRIVCLSTIDPSIIENKQHPFINIIASIQEEVDRHISRTGPYDYKRQDFESRKNFELCYKRLLKGLPVIEGIGKGGVYDDWNDEEFISIKGMEKAELSNKLVQWFHKYVRKALSLMDKDCFVISFDDIDTNFQKGYQLLEVIRKYLTTPQIISILTGDLELYGKLVRKASWQCFNKGFLRKETKYAGRTKQEFSEMINQLENQYLIKIIKPENRIHLKTIYENKAEGNYSLTVRFSNAKQLSIDECYKYILDKTGFSAQNIKMTYTLIQYLEGLSTRVQIRLLTLINNCIPANGEKDHLIASEIMDIFWNDIIQKSSNAKALLNKDMFYVVEMLKFLLEANALYTGNNFMPITSDTTLNKALLAIGAQFNGLVKDKPFMIFDFWLRICYVQFVAEQLGEKQDKEQIRKFLDFTGLDTNDDLSQSIGLSTAYCNNKLKDNLNFINISLPGSAILHSFIPVYRTEENHMLAMLPLMGSLDQNTSETSFVSVYKVLAIIRDILFHIDEYMNGSIDQFNRNYLQLQLNKFSQYRFYIEPVGYKYQSMQIQLGQERHEGNFSIELDPNAGRIRTLAKEIGIWFLKLSRKKIRLSTCSPQLLSRIFTRFYFTTINIDKENGYKNAGDKLHSYIIALLNATLIEEGIDKNIPDLNFNTAGNIDNIFIDNVDRFYKTPGAVNDTLYRWLVECPILRLFLNPYILELLHNTENSQFISEKLRYSRIRMELDFLEKQGGYLNDRIQRLVSAQNWLKSYTKYKDTEKDLDVLGVYLKSKNIKNVSQEFFLQYRKDRDDLRKQRDGLFDNLTSKTMFLPEEKCYLSVQMNENEFLTASATIAYSIKNLNDKKRKNDEQTSKAKKRLDDIKASVKNENKHIENPIYSLLCSLETKQPERNPNVSDLDYEIPDGF